MDCARGGLRFASQEECDVWGMMGMIPQENREQDRRVEKDRHLGLPNVQEIAVAMKRVQGGLDDGQVEGMASA